MKLIKKLEKRPVGKQGRTTPWGLYECPRCKKSFETMTWNVNAGKTTKCIKCRGETTGGHNKTHGETNTKLFKKWNAMIFRCYSKATGSPKHTDYWRDKGVTVCDEWKNDFLAFKKWALNNGYEENLELDKDIMCSKLKIKPRIYSPETCLFITKKENIRQRNIERN